MSGKISNLPGFLEKFRDSVNKTNPDGSVDQSVIFFRNFIAGGTAASIAVTTMAPMERVKLLLQVQSHRANNDPKERLYKGMWDCVIRIPKEQGFFAFWRGNMASVLRCFPYYAFNFALKDKYKDYFVRHIDKQNHMYRRFAGNVLSGGIAGATAVSLIYPLDFARTRLAADIGKTKETREYRGIWHCLTDVYKKDGVYGLYRGFVFSFIGVFIYRAIYFGFYDTGKDLYTSETNKHNLLFGFINAEIAATSSGLLSYPFDTVRRTMMMQSGRPKNTREFESSIECLTVLYQKKGIKGFYNGALTNMVRGTGGALMLVAYDEIHHYLWPRRKPQKPGDIPSVPPYITLVLPEDEEEEEGEGFMKHYYVPEVMTNDDIHYHIKWYAETTVEYSYSCLERKAGKTPLEQVEAPFIDDNDDICSTMTLRERINHFCDF